MLILCVERAYCVSLLPGNSVCVLIIRRSVYAVSTLRELPSPVRLVSVFFLQAQNEYLPS
jgi:hypothetical protein